VLTQTYFAVVNVARPGFKFGLPSPVLNTLPPSLDASQHQRHTKIVQTSGAFNKNLHSMRLQHGFH